MAPFRRRKHGGGQDQDGPGPALAHHRRGSALSDRGHHQAALEEFRQAIALAPDLTFVQYRIALELDFLGRYREALEAVDTAAFLMPGDTAPMILRGAILFDLERYQDALEVFSSVLEREPELGQVHFNQARVLRRLGRYPEALDAYERAFQLAPALERQGARELKAITLALAGRYDEALAEFAAAAAAAAAPLDGTSDVWSAAIAWHRGDPAEARRRFGLAEGKPMGTNPCEARNLRAVVACALGRTGSPADLLGPGYEPDPGVTDVLTRLYELLSQPPLPGIDALRDAALSG